MSTSSSTPDDDEEMRGADEVLSDGERPAAGSVRRHGYVEGGAPVEKRSRVSHVNLTPHTTTSTRLSGLPPELVALICDMSGQRTSAMRTCKSMYASLAAHARDAHEPRVITRDFFPTVVEWQDPEKRGRILRRLYASLGEQVEVVDLRASTASGTRQICADSLERILKECPNIRRLAVSEGSVGYLDCRSSFLDYIPNLRHLEWLLFDCNAEASHALAKIFETNIGGFVALKHVVIRGDDAVAFHQNEGGSFSRAIAMALCAAPWRLQIRTLDLSYTDEPLNAREWAHIVQHLPNIEELNYGGMRDEDTDDLIRMNWCRSLERIASLTRLKRFSTNGSVYLKRLAELNKGITHLAVHVSLHENWDATRRVYMHAALRALKDLPDLVHIRLYDRAVTLFHKPRMHVLATIANACRSLHYAELRILIGDATVEAVAAVFHANAMLRTLHFNAPLAESDSLMRDRDAWTTHGLHVELGDGDRDVRYRVMSRVVKCTRTSVHPP